MVNTREIAWVAGYLEGEGAFTIYSGTPGHRQFRIELSSTDLDVIEKVKFILKANQRIFLRKLRFGHKQEYYIKIYNNLAIQWMMTIYCLMGTRRKFKIREIIIEWKQHIENGSGLCRTCKSNLVITTIKSGWNKGKRQTYCLSCRRAKSA